MLINRARPLVSRSEAATWMLGFYHLDVVVALEMAVAVGTVVMVGDLMVPALLLRRPCLIAIMAFVREVIGVVHVLITSCLASEPSRAGITFECRPPVSRRAAVIIPGLPASWEGLPTRTLEMVSVSHDSSQVLGQTRQTQSTLRDI